jgi:UDP-N-acetylmuramoyl-tripeptide--D-alanyl-D-alanine ligase
VTDGPEISGISIDSRRTRSGDLFFALPGDPGPRFNPSQRSDRDGHDFIDAALGNGAVGVVAHDGRTRHAPQLQVTDTLDALWALGAAARRRLECPVVAVTGSSGKTTVTGFLAAALGGFSAPGSLNNHLGVPLSLVLTPRGARAAVYELGTNHPGEIGPLSRLVRPDVALVLNVHPAHRQNFASMSALTREKLSIHEGLRSGAELVLEEGLPADTLPPNLRVTRFGRSDGAAVRLMALNDRQGTFLVGTRTVTAHVPGGGEHRAMSVAAVLCVVEVLGRDLTAARQLDDSLIGPGRGRELQAGGITIVDDSYNANPESMNAALMGLRAREGARRFALLGEMLELGDESPAYHRALAGQASQLDGVFCVGEGMRPLFEALPGGVALHWAPEPDQALTEKIAATLRRGDIMLVKGSNRVFWVRDYVTILARQISKTEPKKSPTSG